MQTDQGVHAAELPVEKVPAAQLAQVWSVVVVPGVDTKVPATHGVHCVQVPFWVVENVPLMHAVQVRSVLAVPVPPLVPAGHERQGAQVVAFTAWVKVPAAQGAQERSTAVPPTSRTVSPA